MLFSMDILYVEPHYSYRISIGDVISSSESTTLLQGTLDLLVAAMAVYIPARWATKVDPMDALRCD